MIPEELPLTPEEIGRLIKASGRNQKSLAAELGVRSATVSNWVNGVGTPSHENAAKLRAVKPLPRAMPDWTTYMAEVKARIARNRNPPELPLVAVDPEPIAASVAEKVGTAREIAEAVKAAASEVKGAIPTAAEVAFEVKGTLPTARDIAAEVKAVMPTAQALAAAVSAAIPTATEVAAEVKTTLLTARDIAAEVKAIVPTARELAAEAKATVPIAALVKTFKLGVSLVVAVVVVGVGAMVALGYRAVAGTERELASITQPSQVPGVAMGTTRRGFDLRVFLATLLDLGKKKVEENWIPKGPLPGQKEKDCDRRLGEKEINGGCWVGVLDVKPPCELLFRHGDACYRPVSAEPQKPIGIFPDVPGQQ